MSSPSFRPVKIYDYFAVFGLRENLPDSLDQTSFPMKVSRSSEEKATISGINLSLSENFPDQKQLLERFELGRIGESVLFLEVQYQELHTDNTATGQSPVFQVQLSEFEIEKGFIKIHVDSDEVPVPIQGKYSHQENGFSYYSGNYDISPYIAQSIQNGFALVLTYSTCNNQDNLFPLSHITVDDSNGIEEKEKYQQIPVLLGRNRDSYIYFKRLDPLKIKFEPELLDRYPRLDYENFSLNLGIPMFCFEEALTLSLTEESSEILSFILTTSDQHSENIVRTYVTCLIFYDKLRSKTITQLGLDGWVYAPKCICLVSHLPFILETEDILRTLLKYSSDIHQVPIERVICNLVDEVFLQEEKTTVYEFASVEFSPPKSNLPHVPDLSFKKMLSKVSVNNIVNIWNSLLLENSLLIVSNDTRDLIYIIMGFTSLLFPLNWEQTLITFIPEALKEFTGATVSYIAGVSRGTFESGIEIPEGCVVLDIDNDDIINKESIVKLPKYIYKNLSSRLSSILSFDESISQPMSLLSLQDAFLEAQTCLLKDYQVCLKIEDERINFNSKKFLNEKQRKYDSEFYKMFTQTQMFMQFLEKLSSKEVHFFNEALRFERSRNSQCFLQENNELAKEVSLSPIIEDIPENSYFHRRFPSLKPDLFIKPRSLESSGEMQQIIHEIPVMSEPAWANFIVKTAFELWLDVFTKYIPKFPEFANELICVALIKMEDLKTRLVMPTKEMYLKLIEVCGILNLKETAKQVRKRMQKEGIEPTAYMYEVYFKAFVSKNSSLYRQEDYQTDLVLNRCILDSNHECFNCLRSNGLEDIIKNWTQSYYEIGSKCRYCEEIIVPKFSVSMTSNKTESFVLFPPYFLEKEIKTQIELHGKEFILSKSFCDKYSSLFWNLILYFQLFGLPYVWISPNFNKKNMNQILEHYRRKVNIQINKDPYVIESLPVTNVQGKDKPLVFLFNELASGVKKMLIENIKSDEYNFKTQLNPLIYEFEEFNMKKKQLMQMNKLIFNRTFYDETK